MIPRSISSLSASAVVMILGLLVAASVRADVTYAVNTTEDLLDEDALDGVCRTSANTCGLRAAIMQANRLGAPGITTIVVPAGIYTLTRPRAGANGDDTGDLNLTTALSDGQVIRVVGENAGSTVIDASGLDRVFRVAASRFAGLERLTIRGGNALESGGGGILNRGSLTVVDCVIEANESHLGGGIASYGDETPGAPPSGLRLIRTSLRLNAASVGGGLYLTGRADIRDSVMHANRASASGGGISVDIGFPSNGVLRMANSTVSANFADSDGGGIHNYGDTAIYNTSIVDNDADTDRDQDGGTGGGVWNGTGRRFIVVNSLVARNTLRDSPIYNDCRGLLEAYGRNYFYDLTGCNIPNPGSRIVSPNTIGPLQHNGGPTLTHALLPGSEAINTELFACVDWDGVPLATDQRGAPRPPGGICDAGAFEYGASPTVAIFESGFE